MKRYNTICIVFCAMVLISESFAKPSDRTCSDSEKEDCSKKPGDNVCIILSSGRAKCAEKAGQGFDTLEKAGLAKREQEEDSSKEKKASSNDAKPSEPSEQTAPSSSSAPQTESPSELPPFEVDSDFDPILWKQEFEECRGNFSLAIEMETNNPRLIRPNSRYNINREIINVETIIGDFPDTHVHFQQMMANYWIMAKKRMKVTSTYVYYSSAVVTVHYSIGAMSNFLGERVDNERQLDSITSGRRAIPFYKYIRHLDLANMTTFRKFRLGQFSTGAYSNDLTKAIQQYCSKQEDGCTKSN